jgi:FKBP-type peptidyl-prolyl cis-trans isomerase FkpA
MKQGGKATFFIPYNIGYGVRGPDMPPYSTMVVDMEILEVR